MIHSLCQCTGYSYSTLLTPLRIQKYVLARYLIMEYLLKNGWEETAVAHIFERDRSTAYHGLESMRVEREDLSRTLPWRKRMIERFDRSVKEMEERRDMDDNYPFILESHLDHVYGKQVEPIHLKDYGREIC